MTLMILNLSFITKELSLCHKLGFSNLFIFGTKVRRPWLFQPMNSVRSNNLSLKYQRFKSSESKDIVIIKVCGKDSIPFEKKRHKT